MGSHRIRTADRHMMCPAAPAQPSVDVVSAHSVRLSWAGVRGATSYSIVQVGGTPIESSL